MSASRLADRSTLAGARSRAGEALRALGARGVHVARTRPKVLLAAAMGAGIFWMVLHWAR